VTRGQCAGATSHPHVFAGVVRGGGRGAAADGGALVDGDGMEAAFQTPEGSSVVLVNTADALREEDAAGCFALLTAKVRLCVLSSVLPRHARPPPHMMSNTS